MRIQLGIGAKLQNVCILVILIRNNVLIWEITSIIPMKMVIRLLWASAKEVTLFLIQIPTSASNHARPTKCMTVLAALQSVTHQITLLQQLHQFTATKAHSVLVTTQNLIAQTSATATITSMITNAYLNARKTSTYKVISVLMNAAVIYMQTRIRDANKNAIITTSIISVVTKYK